MGFSRLITIALLAACAPRPGTNLAMVREPGRSWHGPIGAVAYGKSGEITVGLGSHVQLTMASCTDHTEARLGASDVDSRVERDERGALVAAIDGRIDVEECSPRHLRMKVWASFSDGGRVDAAIDTALAAK